MNKKDKFAGERVSIEEIYDDTDYGSIGFGISEHNWQDFLESKEDSKSEEDPEKICSCGCQACKGTGLHFVSNRYEICCLPCPIHHASEGTNR